MSKKVVALVLSFIVLGSAGAFAFGIGLQLNGNVENSGAFGPAITFKLDSVPLVFALSYSIGDDTIIGLTGDYWAINKKLVNVGRTPLNWFFGVGFFATAVFADEFQFNGGVRVPVGLNMFVVDGFIEPFIMVAPSFGLQMVPSIATTDVTFPIAAGFRLWFK